MWILFAIAVALLLFLAVLLIRAAMFRPEAHSVTGAEELTIDADSAVNALRELIRCRTVSCTDPDMEEDAEFEKLIASLPRLYPNVARVCEMKRFPDRALLFHWRGMHAESPAVLMAHYDVVPADERAWECPAFEGVIRDGCLWGRGTLDTKVTFNAILMAADRLIEQGFLPQQDLYFAFSGGEEVNGGGAVRLVEYFEENGIEPSFVLDEGGAVVEQVFPGVQKRCALIGIAEKGMLNLSYTVRSEGGHASAPKHGEPIDRLCRACTRVLKHPFRARLTPPAAQMFDTLGRHSTFLYRILFANIRVFLPVLDWLCRRSGGELNALMRTTVAFTQMKGSSAANVIPTEASLVSNIRLNPADTMESAREYLQEVIRDPRVELVACDGMNPSRISRTDCAGWQIVSDAVAQTWKGCIVSPYLMVQCSDARHYGRISDRVYRFSAMELTAEERATIHGNNERIRLENIARSVEFYLRLMKKC